MPTLGEFNTLLRDTIRLGSRVDSLILSAVRQAVLWAERNYNFRYMRTSEVIYFNPTTGVGPYEMSAIPKMVEGVATAESLTDLTKIYWMQRIQLKDVYNFPSERPRAYEVRDDGMIWLNADPDQIYYGFVHYWRYSTFPSITTTNMYTSTDTTLWLLTYAEDFLLYQSLLQIAPALKDAEMAASARPMRDEALRTLLIAEDEFIHRDESVSMTYRGSYNGN